MPLAVLDMRHDTRNVLGQPLPVADWRHQVLRALPQHRRHGHLGKGESPRLREGKTVVEPTVCADALTLVEGGCHVLADLSCKECSIRCRKQAVHAGDKVCWGGMTKLLPRLFEIWAQRCLALYCFAEFNNVVLAHLRHPVKPIGWIRSHTRNDQGRVDTISQLLRACECVRATSGPSGDEAVLGADSIEYGCCISGDINHAAPWVACRLASLLATHLVCCRRDMVGGMLPTSWEAQRRRVAV